MTAGKSPRRKAQPKKAAGLPQALQEYSAKRAFEATPEPAPALAPDRSGPLLFVLQQHAARRLHFDFRLEAGGVLKSWAVPKGPSLNPADKRLAVPTEDHTFEYASFEGVIPEKQYGAGEVIVWDCGAYSPDEDHEYFFHDRAEAERRVLAGLEKGKLSFFLRGVKLKGSFALVRTSDRKSWLLIKHKDRFVDAGDVTARGESVLSGIAVEALKRRRPRERIAAAALAPTGPREPLPAKLAPMLAESGDAAVRRPGAGSTSPSSTATACSRSSTTTGSCSARGAASTTPASFPRSPPSSAGSSSTRWCSTARSSRSDPTAGRPSTRCRTGRR